MNYAYTVADLIISRAGAGAISELCIVAKPSILVPLPSAAEDHQTKNAMALVNKDAAILVKESDAKSILINKSISLINDSERLIQISVNCHVLALEDATNVIANEVLKLVKN